MASKEEMRVEIVSDGQREEASNDGMNLYTGNDERVS